MKFCLLLLALTLNSCAIKGNFAGLYSYYHKMQVQKPDLYVAYSPNTSVCDLTPTNQAKVYLTRGLDLKKCLNSAQKAVVYIWGAKCKSKMCIPLELLQQKCRAQNIDLYVVAEYYDNQEMDYNYPLTHPVFGIDTEYYQSDRTAKYLSGFIFDLTGSVTPQMRYLYFKNGEFVGAYAFIDDIKSD
ncbi:hypothetical protein KIH23_11855 [Flavobacterium sp. CYK-55]|uniref:hypothetical protein n=1 Tax=Flavobacterium sp. CYK-55 TaxID=2835529 RepID=UPI001BCF85B5|nr:hypothetical protein [Flavobacterium sp. CYK-55]MBS7787992.1 hypothetical protein [Flavobacterium sp. CYK-55]